MTTTTIFDRMISNILRMIDTNRFDTKQKILFYKQLHYLLQGGVGLVDALDVISSNSANFAIREITQVLGKYIKAGQTLSYAMHRLPEYFDDGDYHIVRIGEKSGDLPAVLRSLSQEYAYVYEVKNKYISALVYPIFLVAVSMIAILSLFLLVLPSIFSIADQFTTMQLPWTTRVLRDFSVFLQDYRTTLVRIVLGIIVLLSVYISTDTGRRNVFARLTTLPLIGTMTKYYYLIKRCRYMRLMLRAGLSYLETFRLLRNVLAIPAYDMMIEHTISALHRGEPLYKPIADFAHIIPAHVIALIKVGEQTAQLPQALENILDMYESELDTHVARLAKVIEPVLLIVVGGIVVMIALGVFGLILQIMEGVG